MSKDQPGEDVAPLLTGADLAPLVRNYPDAMLAAPGFVDERGAVRLPRAVADTLGVPTMLTFALLEDDCLLAIPERVMRRWAEAEEAEWSCSSGASSVPPGSTSPEPRPRREGAPPWTSPAPAEVSMSETADSVPVLTLEDAAQRGGVHDAPVEGGASSDDVALDDAGVPDAVADVEAPHGVLVAEDGTTWPIVCAEPRGLHFLLDAKARRALPLRRPLVALCDDVIVQPSDVLGLTSKGGHTMLHTVGGPIPCPLTVPEVAMRLGWVVSDPRAHVIAEPELTTEGKPDVDPLLASD